MKKLFILIGLSLVLTIGLSAQFTGSWTLHYDWWCNNTYPTATLVISGGPTTGTFSCAGFTGDWYSEDGSKIVFIFGNGTTYSGTRVGGAMLGMMTTVFTNSTQGCWYANKNLNPVTTSADGNPKDVSGESTGGIGNTKSSE